MHRGVRLMTSTMAASSSSSAAGDPLVHVAFNSKATLFVAATATGVRVFSCSPLKHVFSKTGFDAAAGCEKVASTDVNLSSGSLVAVVFGDSTTGDDRIRYWRELQGELMSRDMDPTCRGAVRHAGDHVLVACDGQAALHEASSRYGTRRACEFDTGPNPLGACALVAAHGAHAFVLACPLPAKGRVQVRRAGGGRVDVHAHNSSVACVALSRDGRLLATAGSRGTLLRVFSTADGNKLQELRRGYDRADIHCLAFSPDSKWLAASSDKGTIHVFRVSVDISSSSPEDGDVPTTASSKAKQGWSLSYFTGFVPVPGYFTQDHVVLIVGMDGSFYRCQFDPVNGGDMEQLEYRNFMKME